MNRTHTFAIGAGAGVLGILLVAGFLEKLEQRRFDRSEANGKLARDSLLALARELDRHAEHERAVAQNLIAKSPDPAGQQMLGQAEGLASAAEIARRKAASAS